LTAFSPPPLLATTALRGLAQADEVSTAISSTNTATGSSSADAVVGINTSSIDVVGHGSVVGSALANLSGVATSTSGNADADAGNQGVSRLLGIDGNGAGTVMSIGGTGSLQGTVNARLTAKGTSIQGNADASSGALDAIGLIAGDSTINSEGTIAGIAQVSQTATALTTAGSGNADAQVNNLSGVSMGTAAPSLLIKASGALFGTANLVSTAAAAITGDTLTDSASALQRVGLAVGLDANGMGGATIGGAGVITGQANVVGTASASATTGNSDATAGAFDAAGIATPTSVIGIRPSPAPLQANGAAGVNGLANAGFSATATTVEGGSTAIVDGNVYGVGDVPGLGGQITIGSNGSLNAAATLDGKAVASTINGAGNNVNALVNPAGGSVTGVLLDGGLQIGGRGTLTAQALLLQQAMANSVQAGDATAGVGGGARPIVAGMRDTTVTIDGASTGLQATGVVNATATANSVSGDTTATNQNGLDVYGNYTSNINIAGAAQGELTAKAKSTERLQASSISGNAKAETKGVRVAGAQGIAGTPVTLTANGSSDTFVASGTYNLNAIASSISGSNSAAGYEIGTGSVYLVRGVEDEVTTFASNGSVHVNANTITTVQANNVQGNSDAGISGSTEAIRSGSNGSIASIGGSGSVTASATTNGSITANSIQGNATAESSNAPDTITVSGIAANAIQDISIKGTGGISGSASIGRGAGNPFKVEANSVSGNAKASVGGSGAPKNQGIVGADLTLQSGGDSSIQASSQTNLDLTAESTNGTSLAQIDQSGTPSDRIAITHGLVGADVVASGSGINQVIALANSAISARAISTSGSSDAKLNSQSAGILNNSNPDPSITVSGNVLSQAKLNSTVMAHSISGSANSSLINDVLGAQSYKITGINSGQIRSDATSIATATAESIANNAIGQSQL